MEAVGGRLQVALDARRAAASAISAVLVIASLFGAWQVNATLRLLPGPNEYNVAAWEVRQFPNKWLFHAGELFRSSPSEAEQDEILRRFFELNGQINSLGNQVSDGQSRGLAVDDRIAELEALIEERRDLQPQATATLESRVSQVVRDEAITRDVLWELVWPPVNAEFTNPPRALARSPRDRIELLGSTLLREDLTLAEAEVIEEEVARSQGVSALSFPTAGVGTYPAIIAYRTDYRQTLEVIAHEWMHNYLFFRPLGFNYYASTELRTINETVADLVGVEIAERVVERWPLYEPRPDPGPAPAPDPPALDLREELRALRGEVDELLEAGAIEEAEALMEQRRRELADQGYFIRKINQAYFAYLNLYAGEDGSVAATDPIGPAVDELRLLSDSLRHFVDIVGDVTSVAQLEAALDALR